MLEGCRPPSRRIEMSRNKSLPIRDWKESEVAGTTMSIRVMEIRQVVWAGVLIFNPHVDYCYVSPASLHFPSARLRRPGSTAFTLCICIAGREIALWVSSLDSPSMISPLKLGSGRRNTAWFRGARTRSSQGRRAAQDTRGATGCLSTCQSSRFPGGGGGGGDSSSSSSSVS